METQWLRDLAAMAGAVTGALALILNWRTRRDIKVGRQPIVKAGASDISRSIPGEWSGVRLVLRSRSNMGYAVAWAAILWPPGARIAPHPAAAGIKPDTGVVLWEKPAKPARMARANLHVRQAGTPAASYAIKGGVAMGSGDEHHEDFLLVVPASRWRSWSASISRRILRRLCSACSVSSHMRRVRLIVLITDEHANRRLRTATTVIPVTKITASSVETKS